MSADRLAGRRAAHRAASNALAWLEERQHGAAGLPVETADLRTSRYDLTAACALAYGYRPDEIDPCTGSVLPGAPRPWLEESR